MRETLYWAINFDSKPLLFFILPKYSKSVNPEVTGRAIFSTVTWLEFGEKIAQLLNILTVNASWERTIEQFPFCGIVEKMQEPNLIHDMTKLERHLLQNSCNSITFFWTTITVIHKETCCRENNGSTFKCNHEFFNWHLLILTWSFTSQRNEN